MKKPSRKKLVRLLDKEVSRIVRERDKFCVLCFSGHNLTAGHLITRSKFSVRWDLHNVFAQCKGCNFSHEFNPHPFTLWYIKQFGQERYEKLVTKSWQIVKYSNADLTEKLDDLKKVFRFLKLKS